MAIIYSYPEIPDVQGGDLLLISDTGAPNKPTRSVDIDDLAAYIGTVVGVVQNLQSVLTVGNTYVSPDGYGTFTLNDIANNDGSITFVNTYEGWGYQISAEEGINITDGSGTNLMSIQSSGLSIRNGAQIMNIGTNTLTATRNVYFPDASGTIALENLSNWYSVTGSRGLGNLLVKIGDYDSSGNGTFLSIDDADQSMIFTKGGVVESKFVFTATQDRDYTFPNADGTIALTSDIESYSEWAEYSGTRAGGDLLVSIGDYDDSGTGFKLELNTEDSVVEISEGSETIRLTPSTLEWEDTYRSSLQPLSVTDNRIWSLPDASGTLALTSDIPAPGPSGSGTTNYTARWTNASTLGIGALYDNGTNVGIGTASPSQKFEVSGNSLVTGTQFIGDTFTKIQQASGNLLLTNQSSSGAIAFLTNSTERVRITSTGNVGIGTTSPERLLHLLASDTAINPNLLIEQAGTGNASIGFKLSGSTEFNMGIDNADGNKFKIHRNYPVGGSNNVLTIDGSNNVGIGTTSPSNRLQVTGGSIGIDSQYAIRDNRNNTILQQSADTLALNRTLTIGNATYNNIIIPNGNIGIGTTSPSVALEVVGGIKLSDNSPLTWTTSNTRIFGQSGYMQLQVASSDVMRLTSAGNVGIGTTSPAEKLHVFGGAAAIEIDSTTNEASLKYDNSTTTANIKLANNDLKTELGGAEVMRILADGKVGIGTTSPGAKLEVSSTSGWGLFTERGIKDGSTSAYSHSYGAGNAHVLGRSTIFESSVTFSTLTANAQTKEYRLINSSNKLVLASVVAGVTTEDNILVASGVNIGMGTNSPTTALHIKHDAPTIRLEDNTSSDNHYLTGNNGEFRVQSTGYITIRPGNAVSTTFNANGNVGIGTTSPSYILDIVSPGTATARIKSAGTGAISLRYENGGGFKSASVVDNNGLYRLDATNISLNPTNNVGIGTTSPVNKQQNKYTSVAINSMTATAGTASTNWNRNAGLLIEESNSSNGLALGVSQTANDRKSWIQSGHPGSAANNLGVLSLNPLGGNVGIGTTSPTKELEIGTNAAAETELRMYSDVSGKYFNIQSAGNFTSIRTTGSQNFILDSSGSSGYVTFVTNASERMRINYNGNIGIGTTAPTTKLQVNGDVRIYDENELYFGGTGSVPSWEIKASGSDLVINDTGTTVGSVLFNNDEGIVLPRLTTTEINAISLPNTGLTVYNTTLNTICFYNGSSWQKVSHANM